MVCARLESDNASPTLLDFCSLTSLLLDVIDKQ